MNIICRHKAVLIDKERIEFEDYTFRGELGRGANGVVFSAVDDYLHRPVAIKIWYSNNQDNRDKLTQGKNEAIKIASIPHVNIVTVFNAGVVGNFFYLVMELLPGKSLRDILTTNPPSLALRINYWSQIVKALQHAYKYSVYHGDLHDRNIIIVENIVKVIDFGTSYFHTVDKVKEEDESSFILKITRNLFPEIENELRKYDKKILKYPQLTLFYCDSWVKLISQLEILSAYVCSDSESDQLLIATLYDIGLNCAKSPYIDMKNILEKLHEILPESEYVSIFLDQCYVYCALILSPENQNSFKYEYNENETEEERIVRVESIRNEIKDLYRLVAKEGNDEIDTILSN